MCNFVTLVYFLLNSITDIKSNSLCAQVTNKFCEYFPTFGWILQQITEFFMHSSHKEIVEKVLGHTKMKCKIGSKIYRIYPCIMRTFFPLKKPRKLRCVLYTESFVLDSRPSLACKQIHEMCPYTIICFELKS